MEKGIKKQIRNQMIRSVFLTIIPFAVPIIIFEIIPNNIIDKIGKIIIMILVICIDIYFVLKYTKEDAVDLCKYQEIKHDKKKYRISQSTLSTRACRDRALLPRLSLFTF